MGDWKTIKKGNKTAAHPTSLSDSPQLSSSGSFGVLAVDDLKSNKPSTKQPSQFEQIPKTAPPPITATNASPRSNSNTKTKLPPNSTKTVLADLKGQESAQMKKSAPASKTAPVKANAKARKANVRTRVPKKSRIIGLRTLLLMMTAYAAYHWAYTCPSQGNPPRSSATNVCKSLHHLEHGVWRPYGVPAVQYLASTKPVREAQEQYDTVVRPYVDPLVLQSQQLHRKYGAPILSQAKSMFVAYGEPVVAHTQTLYRQHVDPHVQKGYSAVMKEYDTYLGKHVNAAYSKVHDFWKKQVAPHAVPVAKAANGVFDDYVVPALKRTVPIVQRVGAAAATVYRENILPLTLKSIAIGKDVYEKHVVPTINQLWDEHGKPHYEAVLSKLGFKVQPAPKRSPTTKATEAAKAMYDDVVEGVKVRATEAAQAVKSKSGKASEAAEGAKAKVQEGAAAAKKKAEEIAAKEAARAKQIAAEQAAKAKAKAHEVEEAAKAKTQKVHEAAKVKAQEAEEAAKAKAQKAQEAAKAKAHEAQEAAKAKAKSAQDAAKVKAGEAAKHASEAAHYVSDTVGGQAQHVMKMADDAKEVVREKVKDAKNTAVPKVEGKVKGEASQVKEKVVPEVKKAAQEAKKKTKEATESAKAVADKSKESVTDAAKKMTGQAQKNTEAKIRHAEL